MDDYFFHNLTKGVLYFGNVRECFTICFQVKHDRSTDVVIYTTKTLNVKIMISFLQDIINVLSTNQTAQHENHCISGMVGFRLY